jgi:hypothetical protein
MIRILLFTLIRIRILSLLRCGSRSNIYFNSDPDSDPDPSFFLDAFPDPQQLQGKSSRQCYLSSFHFDLDPDPDPAFQCDADADLAFQLMHTRIRIRLPTMMWIQILNTGLKDTLLTFLLRFVA